MNDPLILMLNQMSTDDVGFPPLPCTIRPCCPDDVGTLLVRGLAEFERLEAFVRATEDDFRAHLFGPRPIASATGRGPNRCVRNCSGVARAKASRRS